MNRNQEIQNRTLENIHAKMIWNQVSNTDFDYEHYCEQISRCEIGTGNITFRYEEIDTIFRALPLSKEIAEEWHVCQRDYID